MRVIKSLRIKITYRKIVHSHIIILILHIIILRTCDSGTQPMADYLISYY